MNKEKVYEIIREWESKHGESLLDQGFNLNELTYMTWCFGKGYINRKQYNDWSQDYLSNKLEAIDANYYVYNDDGEYGVSYAIISSDEWEEEYYEKAYMILAEFISEMDVYIKRLEKFIED